MKHTFIAICTLVINKYKMKKEVKSWVDFWMRKVLNLQISLWNHGHPLGMHEESLKTYNDSLARLMEI